jgi:hypothetical protein
MFFDSQMFLLSTVLCQVTLSLTSSFPMAVGQMMVENIPFMHVISHIAVQNQGMSQSRFAVRVRVRVRELSAVCNTTFILLSVHLPSLEQFALFLFLCLQERVSQLFLLFWSPFL